MGANTLNNDIREMEAYHGGKTEAWTDSADNTFSGSNTHSGTETFTGTVSMAGASGYPAKQTVEAHTASDALLAAESGSIHTSVGATAAITLTLPTAAAGLKFDIVVGAAQTVNVYTDGTDIMKDSSGTATAYANSTAGSVLPLVAINDSTWQILGSEGTWA